MIETNICCSKPKCYLKATGLISLETSNHYNGEILVFVCKQHLELKLKNKNITIKQWFNNE